MKRHIYNFLSAWKDRSNRKPLVVRGARQVGKTYIVREFGSSDFDYLIEINFDENPEKADLFESSDLEKILNKPHC